MADRTDRPSTVSPPGIAERTARPVVWFNYALIVLTGLAVVVAMWAWVAGTSPARQDTPAPTTPSGRPAGPPAQ